VILYADTDVSEHAFIIRVEMSIVGMQSGHIDRLQRRWPHRSTEGKRRCSPSGPIGTMNMNCKRERKKEKTTKMALLCLWIQPSFLQPAI
jgi:hypothetical protein